MKINTNITFCGPAYDIAERSSTEEQMESDSATMFSINSYSMAAGGICIVIMIVLIHFIYAVVQVFANYWLSYWINEGSGVSIRITCRVGRQL